MPIITIQNLSKIFTYPIKSGSWIQDFVKPQKKQVNAVDSINLSVEKGEAVAFIGPNGAGKSTTIKMLTGILYPTNGEISVAGFTPYKQRKELSYKIGTVFAQRTQLIFNLPVTDSLELFAKIYELPTSKAKSRISELVELLSLAEFLNQPVRKLSLGQRMRAEIALALIHDPEVIFLDEPTIGLDVVAKRNLRDALVNLNKEKGITLFLTSHDVGDIEALADRTVIINKGKIIIDEPTTKIKSKVMSKKIISLDAELQDFKINKKGVEIISSNQHHAVLELDTAKTNINELVNYIVDNYQISDINIEDPSLEEIITSIYEEQL